MRVNRRVCPDHYRLGLVLPEFPPSRPGQFVHILCGTDRPLPGARPADWPEGRAPRLTQPELAGRRQLPDGSVELDILQRVVGVGTAYLAELPVGAEVSLLGPLGRSFAFENAPATAALIGGGAGIPPMIYLADCLRQAGREVVAFAGARTRSVLPLTIDMGEPPSQAGWPTLCAAEFAAHGVPTALATDDGSLGFGGLVSEAFVRWAERRGTPSVPPQAEGN